MDTFKYTLLSGQDGCWPRHSSPGLWLSRMESNRDFLGGPVVKNPPAREGDTGSIPEIELRD